MHPDVSPVPQQQTVPTPAANAEPDVVPYDRPSSGGDDHPNDIEVVGRAGVESRGKKHRFPCGFV